MKFGFLDSFLVFTILSFLSGLIIPTSSSWTTFLILIYLLTSHQRKGTKNNQGMGLLVVGQLEQVYGTIYVYRRPGILGLALSWVGG